ncbi:MAG: transporter [Pseudomonadota bacterium]
MTFKSIGKCFWTFMLVCGTSFNVFAIDNPCSGLLNIVERPSNADSTCVVPFKQALLEAGYQYQQLSHSNGQQQNFPDTELRIGLPASNELTVLLPNYIHQTMAPHYGNTAAVVGIKHEIGYNEHWIGSVEALFTMPNGSSAFGSNGLGTTVNAIVGYTFNPKFNLTFMIGGSTLTESSLSGGQRYSSINPDVVFTYSPSERLDWYGEVYGQSKTAPGASSGFDADAGVLFLILPNWEIDLEVGQRISGNLTGFAHYIGTGMSILF